MRRHFIFLDPFYHIIYTELKSSGLDFQVPGIRSSLSDKYSGFTWEFSSFEKQDLTYLHFWVFFCWVLCKVTSVCSPYMNFKAVTRQISLPYTYTQALLCLWRWFWSAINQKWCTSVSSRTSNRTETDQKSGLLGKTFRTQPGLLPAPAGKRGLSQVPSSIPALHRNLFPRQ